MDPLSLAWEEGNYRFKKAGSCLIRAVRLVIPWTRGWAAWAVACIGSFITKQTAVLVVPLIRYQPRPSATREKTGGTFMAPSMPYPSTYLHTIHLNMSIHPLSPLCLLLANIEASQIFLK